MKYSEIIKELERYRVLSGEDNPNIVVADSRKSYEFPIRKVELFYNSIGIMINA